jgi:hypothetical protein
MGILGNCCNRISNKLCAATYEFLRATLISTCILVRIRTAQWGFTHAQLNCFGCSMQFVAFVYGLFHFVMKLGANGSGLQNVHFSSEEDNWWLFPTLLVIVKCVQARMIDLHIANLEVQDRTLYSEDPDDFWES